MKKIAIIVAMQSEFELVKNIFADCKGCFDCRGEKFLVPALRGEISGNEVFLMKCGIGKVNAGVQTAEIIAAFQPDFVINTGVAGGIDKILNVGDVVISEQCAYHDVWCGEGSWGQIQGLPLFFDGDKTLIEICKDVACKVSTIHFGLICTGDQFVTELSVLQQIKNNFPSALAVDMESAAMAHVCFLRKTPFVSIRVISDSPCMEHDNLNQYFDFFKDAPKRTFGVLEKILEKKFCCKIKNM
ncbi:MAG: 5'-methylthioadenosine/adenosylhomocysteine nucleosidase [Prevotellaceae bacterium]|jgi:adenosylhomocysteine nucleosidase|nr:5'-methylthioadenosine/adenosylhomocysteine nucleosidase [Prevotellaceae bacterium]